MPKGRKPKPTKLKIADGNPSKRPIHLEPSAPSGEPKMPTCMDRVAKAKWRELVPMLNNMGILTKIDGECLGCFCQAYSEWWHAVKQLAKEGTIIEQPPSNRMAVHPAVSVKNDAMRLMATYGARLGLSPVDRARLAVAPSDQEKGELDDFLSGAS